MSSASAQRVAVSRPRPLRVERLGVVPYAEALAMQQQRHAQVQQGTADDTLLLLQHPPVITLGRNADRKHLLVSEAELKARGIELFDTGRGGDITYHGPGQAVGYPIVHLGPGERDVKRYVWRLEELVLRASADLGVDATRVEGLRGVWANGCKLAAIGVRISRWTTLHGFALNVRADLHGFGLIVPCGLHQRGITSLEQLLGEAPSMARVEERLAVHAAEVLERSVVALSPAGAARRGSST